MAESILNHKRLLLVDDEPDILALLEEEIFDSCPDVTIDKATNYEDAANLLESNDYDLVVLDIMGVRGFDLLEIAVRKKFKAAMLTAHALNPNALTKSHEMGAAAFLPKEKLGEMVPFLEDVLRYDSESGWEGLMKKLNDYYTNKFGTGGWNRMPQ